MKIEMHVYGWLIGFILLISLVIGIVMLFRGLLWEAGGVIGGAIIITALILLYVHKKHPDYFKQDDDIWKREKEIWEREKDEGDS